jgi:hypothetical protein
MNNQTLLIGFALALSLAPAEPAVAADADYVAHEWGTFTSIQGSDGVQLDWQPFQTTELPGFVYNWSKPGLARVPAIFGLLGGKGGMTAQQRMETPVIYFYSDKEQHVDVSVKFPKGFITEWYPQASLVGPAMVQTNSTDLDSFSLPYSGIRWKNVWILPANRNRSPNTVPPMDQSGSHYFAARDTDSAALVVDSYSTNALTETEKFLFYRGIGRFATPLKVTSELNGDLTLTNTGVAPLKHLLLLSVKRGHYRFADLKNLAVGESKLSASNTLSESSPINDGTLAGLHKRMTASLVAEGLTPAEANAMVNTWQNSWFTEEGVRVLYVLPRDWTEATLPLQLTPAPRELVRVMVARAEIIPATLENDLRNQLAEISRGDVTRRKEALAEVKQLGRFMQPVLGRVIAKTSLETNQLVGNFFAEALTAAYNQTASKH